MKRIFKTRVFDRWMRKVGLTDDFLCLAVEEMERGLIDAELGGGLVKKRVALPGRGKSGGARTIVATNRDNRWFFVFGFEKNERGNINADELKSFKLLAEVLLKLSDYQLSAREADKKIMEICHAS